MRGKSRKVEFVIERKESAKRKALKGAGTATLFLMAGGKHKGKVKR